MDGVRTREREVFATSHMPWFHSNVSREATERMLHQRADGTFLVRESTNFPGDYTLSMAYRGKVEHYRIYQSGGQITCDNEEFFTNLTQLVSHYKRDADGLCHRLVTPVICESYQILANNANLEDRTSAFLKAGLVIPSGDIRLGDIIGHGEFGDVLVGYYKDKKVAVKVSKRHGNGMLDSLLDESRFMVGLSHRNLVALIGVVLDDINIYMVTEYMANGNLVDLLRSRGRHQLDKLQLVQFAVDICGGMCYLESRQIVHRDLAARNVLLDEDYVAKVSDFGLAKKAHSSSQDNTSGKFPIKWTAPEALRHSNFSSKSDMWSFGVLLWEIFSFGRVPYPRIGVDGRSPIQDVVRHIERGYRMEAPEGCPTDIFRIMNDAWALHPQDRPTFGQVLQRLVAISRVLSH
ncbi:Tyrosine-protein kinase csk-1 [Parelaphostrongylus tenuis]|uniref:Tyrosine-protein kinase n=1 Tax=Parelaphostrongylus tenuis TaxID=148309 RepID=A0AAD5QXB6_PARTN|nr:Tyrosine-protein kinase csk-1 [Parelaphostrongylus tenuis]